MCFNNTAFAASETEKSAEDTKIEKDNSLKPEEKTGLMGTQGTSPPEEQISGTAEVKPNRSFLSKVKSFFFHLKTKTLYLRVSFYRKLIAVKAVLGEKLKVFKAFLGKKLRVFKAFLSEKLTRFKKKSSYYASKGFFSTKAKGQKLLKILPAVKKELKLWVKISAVILLCYVLIMSSLYYNYLKRKKVVRQKILAQLKTERKEVLDRLKEHQYVKGAQEVLNTNFENYKYCKSAGDIPDPELALSLILISETNFKRKRKYMRLLSELKEVDTLTKVSKKTIKEKVQKIYDVFTQWYLTWLKQTDAYKTMTLEKENSKKQQKLPFFSLYVRLNLLLKKYGFEVRNNAHIGKRLSLAEKLKILHNRKKPLKLKLLDQFINEHADVESVKDNPYLLTHKTFISAAISTVNAEVDHALN